MPHPAVARPVAFLMAALCVAAGCHRPASVSRPAAPPLSPEMAAAADAAFQCAMGRAQGNGFVLVTIKRKERTASAVSDVVSVDELAGGPREVDYLNVAVGVRPDSTRDGGGVVVAYASGESERVRAEGSYDDPQHQPYMIRTPIPTSGRVRSAVRAVRTCSGDGGAAE